MNVTLGIDPGITGALAALDEHGRVRLLEDLPVIRDRSLAWIDGGALMSLLLRAREGASSYRLIVERVSAMPGQGVASSFGFGVTLGSILATAQAVQMPIEFVTPAVWKRALGLDREKSAALNRARLLFPSADLTLAKHHGRAEALLIAYWALERSKSSSASSHRALDSIITGDLP